MSETQSDTILDDRAAEPSGVTLRNPSDRQLLERFVAQRDAAAFAGLVERYGRTVWNVCRQVLPREQDIEDSFQAFFLLLANKAAGIRKGDAVGSWIYGVAQRTARRARWQAQRRQEQEKKAVWGAVEPAPWSEAAARELQRMLDEEIQRLAEKYRTPFVLCCLEGMSRAEAAQELGWKEGTLSSRLATARQVLQKRLVRRGVTLSAALAVGALAQSSAAQAALPALIQTTVHGVTGALAGQATTLTPGALALTKSLGSVVLAGKVKAALAFVILLAVFPPLAMVFSQADPQPSQPKPQAPPPQFILAEDAFLQPPETILKPLEEEVYGLAFSRDDHRLFMVGTSQRGQNRASKLIVWDVATSKKIFTVDPMGGVRSVALSPDGQTLVCGEFGGAIWLRDPANGAKKGELKGHRVGVNGVAFSADGQQLVSAGLDKKVKLWDIKKRAELKEFVGHSDMVLSVAMFGHGQGFVTGGKDKVAKIWDIVTGEKFTLGGHTSGVEMVAISSDDKMVATTSWDGTVRIWEAATGKNIGVLEAKMGSALAVAFSPDGTLIASTTGSGGVFLWDAKTFQKVAYLGRHNGFGWTLVFSHDGKTLASGSYDSNAKLWDVQSCKEITTLWTREIRPILAMAQGPDGKKWALAQQDKSIHFLETKAGFALRVFPGQAAPARCLSFSPDGQTVASGGSSSAIFLWNSTTGQEKSFLPGHAGGVTALAYSPQAGNGEMLASAGEDNSIKLWEPASGQEIGVLAGHELPVQALAFTSDGRILASGGADKTIRLWNVDEKKEIGVLYGHAGSVRALAFVSQNKLVSAGDEGFVKLWDLAEKKELFAVRTPAKGVRTLAVAPGGRIFVSGSQDGRLLVWDAATGRPRQLLNGHKGEIVGLAFDLRTGALVSAGLDEMLLRWHTPTSKVATEKSMAIDAQQASIQAAKMNQGKPVPSPDGIIYLPPNDASNIFQPNIQSQETPSNNDSAPPQVAPQKKGWWIWLVLALLLFAGGTVALGAWVRQRGKRSAEASGAADHPDQAKTPIVSFACPECGKKLKATAELAGKKIKCLQCAKVLTVPPPQESVAHPPRQVMGKRVGMAMVAIGLIGCCVLAGLALFGGTEKTEDKPPQKDDARLLKVAEILRALKSDVFDAPKSLPDMRDEDLSQLKGNTQFRNLLFNNSSVTDEGMKIVNTLTGLQRLSLSNTGVTDEGLAYLTGLKDLEELRLDKLRITDAGLEHLKAFPKLKKLTLWRTPITNAGLVHLKSLAALEYLSLDETQISGDGIKELHHLTGLQYVSIYRTQINAAAVEELKRTLPRVRVNK